MANGKPYTSVIAIGKTGDWYRAVAVSRTAGRFEITRYFSCEAQGRSLALFAGDLRAAGWQKQQPDSGTPLVILFEGQSVVYRHIEVPAKGERELDSIVRMQAEALLPLGPDELELGWREGQTRNGRIGVTLAATRSSSIRSFADEAAGIGPARIVLELDGFVRAWSEACSLGGGKTILARIRRDSTDVCLVEDGLLSQATRIDTGMNDLFKEQPLSITEAERLKRDIEGAAELFGTGKDAPVHIVSDGSANVAAAAKYLADSGLPVRASAPRGWAARDGAAIPAAELYQYMSQAGAAMLVLEGTKELNVFGRLYRPQEARDESPKGPGLRKAALIGIAALVATVFAWYGLDKLELQRLEGLLQEERDGISVLEMLDKHKAINETAAERPDMLEILSLMKESAPEGVTLHSFTFRKGKPVSITGQARTNDSLYKFEAALRDKKSIISNVKEQSAVKDDKENKVVFTVTFDYRTFTKGQSEPLAAFGR